ncbi:uncharacterized protein TNCV_2516841 [Trichonephila clavipes]|nr:uncharacterized protein TNCV_2516841 [Trichonephila clavipes]
MACEIKLLESEATTGFFILLGEQGNKAVLDWVMKEGLIPSRYECPKCKKGMRLVERKGTIDGFEWRCRVQSKENPYFVCRSVRKGGMWFSHSRLSICVILRLTRKLESWRIEREPDGRQCLKEARAPCIAVKMEAIASEAASGTSSAPEAARRLGLPPSSVSNILRRILLLYPCKLQSCHELLPADTAQREAFAKWAFSKREQDPTWVFNILWTDRAHFLLHGDVKNHNCRIWATSNPREYTQKPLHSPKVTAWCGFTGSFIIGPFFFETQCQVNVWMDNGKGQILNVTFMQDGATSHIANPVKAFLIQTFGEDRIVSRRSRYPWPPRFPDLTPADFWLWGYLKSRVYLSGPSSLSELKDAIRREVSSIHSDMLHSAVAGFDTRLECLLPCGGGHVEHILMHFKLLAPPIISREPPPLPSVLTLPVLVRGDFSLNSLTLSFSLSFFNGDSFHYPPPMDPPCPGLATDSRITQIGRISPWCTRKCHSPRAPHRVGGQAGLDDDEASVSLGKVTKFAPDAERQVFERYRSGQGALKAEPFVDVHVGLAIWRS